MVKASEEVQVPAASGEKHVNRNWGVWLFRAALVATLVYSWWLLIYSHGAASHHP